MLEETEVLYKNLKIKLHTTPNYLEVLIDDTNFSDQKNYITSVSILLELALTIHPQYIILNKLHSTFKIARELYAFTERSIIDPLKNDGVKKIICLAMADEVINHYRQVELIEPFIKGFSSKEEALIWMTENS
jgi:hypothetical protein